jgi:hypothetical protein
MVFTRHASESSKEPVVGAMGTDLDVKLDTRSIKHELYLVSQSIQIVIVITSGNP